MLYEAQHYVLGTQLPLAHDALGFSDLVTFQAVQQGYAHHGTFDASMVAHGSKEGGLHFDVDHANGAQLF